MTKPAEDPPICPFHGDARREATGGVETLVGGRHVFVATCADHRAGKTIPSAGLPVAQGGDLTVIARFPTIAALIAETVKHADPHPEHGADH